MNQKSLTKDERYLIALYEEHLKSDEEELAIDRHSVGDKAKLSAKGVNSTVHQLIRGNFVRKKGEVNIILTTTGIEVAKNILENG